MLKNKIVAAVSVAALACGLASCSSSGEDKTLTLGYMPAWTDTVSGANLLKEQFTEAGYDVELEELSDAAVFYTALDNGDIDIFPLAWSERTHKKYMDQYGENLEDLGIGYDKAESFFAVPTYMDDVNSISDLKGQADRFGGKIVGIEPGAGLTELSSNTVDAYGLEDEGYTLATSSTPAMLAELENAIDNKEDIVVTLWSPFWANSQYDIKRLEDPEGSMGEPENMHWLAREGFSEQFPDVADYLGNLTLDQEQYESLENLIVNEYEDGDEDKAVQEWLGTHGDALPKLNDA